MQFYIKWIIYIVLHEIHGSGLGFIIRGSYVRQMYTETQKGLGSIHREKVIQELWSLMTQIQSTAWAGVNLWFIQRVTLIYTCLVSDAVSINIYNILLSETECWATGTAAWSSWAVLTQFYLQMQSLELRERSNFMSRGSMTALGAIVKCFPLKHWKLRALLFAF